MSADKNRGFENPGVSEIGRSETEDLRNSRLSKLRPPEIQAPRNSDFPYPSFQHSGLAKLRVCKILAVRVWYVDSRNPDRGKSVDRGLYAGLS